MTLVGLPTARYLGPAVGDELDGSQLTSDDRTNAAYMALAIQK